MRTPRCGIVPPYLLKHLARSGQSARAERARRTLLADRQHRTTRAAPGPSPLQQEGVAPNRTIYDAEHTENLPGTRVRAAADPQAGDASVDRAWAHLGATIAFFSEAYGRDSLDDRGLPLIGTVHYGRDYANAFWDGQQMVFGDGDGEVFRDFTIPLDVVAHELTHGLTQYTAGLDYEGQAGALNESVSDVFGSLVKQHHLGQTADTADWLIGDGLFTDHVQGAALRSMKAPGTAYDDDVLGKDPQPATMADYVVTSDDNGGVHINSGIPNYAFYVLAIDLGGRAWDRAGRIWYTTLTTGSLPPDITFDEFATATHATATDLYGPASAEADAVEAAWATVGITARLRPNWAVQAGRRVCRVTTEPPSPHQEGHPAVNTITFTDDNGTQTEIQARPASICAETNDETQQVRVTLTWDLNELAVDDPAAYQAVQAAWPGHGALTISNTEDAPQQPPEDPQDPGTPGTPGEPPVPAADDEASLFEGTIAAVSLCEDKVRLAAVADSDSGDEPGEDDPVITVTPNPADANGLTVDVVVDNKGQGQGKLDLGDGSPAQDNPGDGSTVTSYAYPAAGSYTVVFTSSADASRTASADVTVPAKA